jgi:surface carbohydrate biosynthesis protein/FkbM family methyltransferase
MRIILFYDNWIRDYRGFLLLKEILRRRGHAVWIAPLWKDPKDVIQDINPHLVVMGQISEKTTSDIGLYIKNRGINLIISTPESVENPDRFQNFFTMNFREWNTAYIDLQILVNHDMYQFVLNHPEIKDKHKYRHIGFPRFDLSVFPEICQNETNALKEKYGISKFEKRYLYISSFIYDDSGGQVSEENIDDVPINANIQRETIQKEHHEGILREVVENLEKENGVLLIKQHPWDKSSHFKDVFNDERVIIVDNHDYIVPVLQLSDIVLHAESTVAVEAWLQRKKTVSLLPGFNGDRKLLKNHMQYEPIVGHYEELVAVLNHYPWSATEASLHNYALSTDGMATIRFANLIDTFGPKKDLKTISKTKKSQKTTKREQKLSFAERLSQLPTDGYEYHLHYIEQFRRNIDKIYEEPIRRFAVEHLSDIKGTRGRSKTGDVDYEEVIAQTEEVAADFISTGCYSDAISLITTALSNNVSNAHLQYLMGRALQKEGKPNHAKEFIERAAVQEPQIMTYQYELAKLLFEQLEENKNAMEICRKIVQQETENIDTWWLIARIALRLHDDEKATEAAKKIVEIEPCHPGANKILNGHNKTENMQCWLQNSETVVADPNLDNIKKIASQDKKGLWRVVLEDLNLFTRDLASFYIAAKDIFLNRIYDFKTPSVKPVVIDGGGHIGLFTIFVKKKYPLAKVVVFEPDPSSKELLLKNLSINEIDGVTVIGAGLYDHIGKVGFHSDGSDGSTITKSGMTQQIDVVRLFPYLDGPVDCLKLNIEGAELPVLKDVISVLPSVQQLFIEYHGFPELGQQLHNILHILDSTGFRYIIHDFDHQTNPATKPPFKLDYDTRFFLLLYAKKMVQNIKGERISFQSEGTKETLNSATTANAQSDDIFILQYYMDIYLQQHQHFIKGNVAFVGKTIPASIHAVSNTNSINLNHIINEIEDRPFDAMYNPEARFYDCIILGDLPPSKSQCLRLLHWSCKVLQPGGTLLIINAGCCCPTHSETLRLTDHALSKIVEEVFGPHTVKTTTYGNMATVKALIDGQPAHILSSDILDFVDPDYQVVVGARMSKNCENILEPAIATKTTLSGMAQVEPTSRKFGFDRGQPIDRYYIETFLNYHRNHIRGRVLEIGDDTYTRRYGTKVKQADVLNAEPGPGVTVVGDLVDGAGLTSGAYDCIILTQTLQCIYAAKEALMTVVRALRPGGTILLTASGISQVSRYDMDRWGEFWRFTNQSLEQMINAAAPECDVLVTPHGNAVVAKAFLDGLAKHEVPVDTLNIGDPNYQVLVTATIIKPCAGNQIPLSTLASKKMADNTGPSVLLYHRVAEDPVDAHLLTVSPEHFEEQIKLLRDSSQVVSLDRIIKTAEAGMDCTEMVAVTFDDGYADNLIHALPVINAYQVPVTVFVTSGAIDAEKEFWWDSLEHLFFEGTLPDQLDIRQKGFTISVPTRTPQQRMAAYETLCTNMRSATIDDLLAMLKEIYDKSGRVPKSCSAHRQLSSDQLQTLARSPWVEIGAHTMNHPRLSSLTPDDQMREIYSSKRQLEALLHQPVSFFSYPFGASSDFSESSVEIVRKCGFQGGLANFQGRIERPMDRFRIPRRLVRNWETATFYRWLTNDKAASEIESQAVRCSKQRLLEHLIKMPTVTDREAYA